MSSNKGTEFQCAFASDDCMRVATHGPEVVIFEVDYAIGDGLRDNSSAALNRAQVESLRDQLTEWLEVTK